MGRCRNLMPVNLIDEWKDWLIQNNNKVFPTKAPYGLFVVRILNQTYVVYKRMETHAGNETVHVSLYGPLIALAKKFIKARKAKDK